MATGLEGVLDTIAPAYFIFGERGDTVDLADHNGDVVTGISRAQAERLIADRDALRALVLRLAGAMEPGAAYRIITE